MACRGCEARKRFLINGVTSAATTLHAKYLKPAREFLESVKQQMSFGKLDQLTQRYENEEGVKFTASSRFGQDEMIIDVPHKVEEPEEKKEEPKKKVVPYLWVGARIVYTPDSTVSLGGFILMVIEPGRNGLVIGEESFWGPHNDSSPVDKTLRPQFDGFSSPLNIENQATKWFSPSGVNFSWVPANRYMYQARDVGADGSGGVISFTKHLLRHYDIFDIVVPAGEALVAPPHDPKETAELIAARVPSQYGSFGTETLWDQVVVLDPDEGGAEPTSHRPQDKAALNIISTATGITQTDCVLPGDYIIKVMAVGADCKSPSSGPAYGWNEDQTEYITPMTIEVEVRVGKAPNTITKRFTTVISAFSELFMNMWPFGNLGQSFGSCYFGPNPHMNAWSQSAILANPYGKISVVNTIPDVFDKFTPSTPACIRFYWDIYVAIFQPYCAYATGSYDTEAANLIYNGLLVFARSGALGGVDAPRRTEAEVAAAAVGVIDPSTGEGLYYYDYVANTFTKIPAGSYDTSLSTLDPVDATHQVWEDDFRHTSMLQCRGFAKVRFGNGELFDGFVHADDPQWFKDEYEANCGVCPPPSTAWHEVGQP